MEARVNLKPDMPADTSSSRMISIPWLVFVHWIALQESPAFAVTRPIGNGVVALKVVGVPVHATQSSSGAERLVK